MKIAIYHQLPSGGAKRALYEMVRGLKKQHELTLFTHEGAETYLDLSKLVHKTVWLARVAPEPVGKIAKIVDSLSHSTLRVREVDQERLARQIDDGTFDCVFVHASQYTQSPSILQYLSTRSVYYSQEVRRVWYEKRLRQRMLGTGLRKFIQLKRESAIAKIDARNISRANVVCVNSHHSAEAHKRAYGVETTVVYLGINCDEFMLPVKPKSNPQGHVRLLTVGGLEEFKNQGRIIQAMSELKAEMPSIQLDCVYDRKVDSYLEYTKTLAHSAGVKVVFHENIPNKELIRMYGNASAVVCVADLEPFGFTPLEAMACGTLAVALNEGGYRETVREGETGSFIRSLAAEDIADAVRRVRLIRTKPRDLHLYVENSWKWSTTIAHLNEVFGAIYEN